MTEDYKDNITSLDIDVVETCLIELLLQPSFVFKSLESLSLSPGICTDDTIVRVCETMLDKHANNLKKIRIDVLEKNLRVPNLPLLESLTLICVDEEAAWNILVHCRPRITRLDLTTTEMNSQLLNSNSEAYEIPNIEQLKIDCSKGFNFVHFNAEHLVTLELRYVYDIPDNVVWPQFPELRELKIDTNSKCLPILINSRETLKHLYLEWISPSDIAYASVVMPRLTDLHVIYVHNAFTSKFCGLNLRSLEFLVLNSNNIPNLDDGIMLERMRNVVLMSTCTAQPRDYRERMIGICLNAEVVIMSRGNRKEIRDQIRSRSKSKKFIRF